MYLCLTNDLAYNKDELGLRSLTASGSKAAAYNEVCTRSSCQWKSDGGKDGYVEDSAEQWMIITKYTDL